MILFDSMFSFSFYSPVCLLFSSNKAEKISFLKKVYHILSLPISCFLLCRASSVSKSVFGNRMNIFDLKFRIHFICEYRVHEIQIRPGYIYLTAKFKLTTANLSSGNYITANTKQTILDLSFDAYLPRLYSSE